MPDHADTKKARNIAPEQSKESDSKMAKKLRHSAAAAVREHDRNKNDNTGRVHHGGPGK